jgi:hypothetical protein
MLRGLRSRLTYANVMATLAVFIALGGTSVAAVSLKRGSVKEKHIASNAVTSPKVKNGSLLLEDFRLGQLPKGENGDAGARGAQGEQGRPGSQGEQGAQGERGLQGLQGEQGVGVQGEQGRQGERGPGAVKIVFNAAGGAPPQDITVGPWEIEMVCSSFGTSTNVFVGVRGSGDAQYAGVTAVDDGTQTSVTGGTALSAVTAQGLLFATADDGHYHRVAGDIQLHSGSQIATVSVNGFADRRGAAPGSCAVFGTVVPAL